MKRWIKKFERIFISVAFAEMDEHDDARNMLRIKYMDPKVIWDDVFISVTFAEAG
jgi:hypothetical protein